MDIGVTKIESLMDLKYGILSINLKDETNPHSRFLGFPCFNRQS